MKKNLENTFKERLKDYEVPYDPKAWEAVSAKLDARSTVGGKGSLKVLKWAAAVVLMGGLVFGVYHLIPNENSRIVSSKTNSDINNKVIVNKDSKSSETPSNKNTSISIKGQDSNIQNTKEPINGNVNVPSKENSDSPKVPNLNSPVNTHNPDVYRNTNHPESTPEERNIFTPTEVDSKSNQFIEGHISMLNICEGENIVISNPNKDKKLVKFQEGEGQIIVLNPGKSYVFMPESTTTISFLNDENEPIVTKQINVHSLPAVNFTYEANIYDKGLPIVVCEAFGEYASYNWTFDKNITRDGAKAIHNFFKEGDHEVSLRVIDRNGCENTMVKTVNIRNNYNLMAVDAFLPNGSDPKTRTFMPYSLTERDVKFQLTIVDPTDNGVVFTSKDAKDAWDGTDQRTGKMTVSNKTFIWKVQIYNPVPNERPIYSGTIVHN